MPTEHYTYEDRKYEIRYEMPEGGKPGWYEIFRDGKVFFKWNPWPAHQGTGADGKTAAPFGEQEFIEAKKGWIRIHHPQPDEKLPIEDDA